jgi:hypothetical protein
MKLVPATLTALLLFATIGVAKAQRRPAPKPKPAATPSPSPRQITTESATTDDGRAVILRSDGTWENDPNPRPKATPTPAPQLTNGTVSLQAGIVYKQGGPQPVARVKFALLDQSLQSILQQANFSYRRASNLSLIDQYAFAVRYGSDNQSAFEAVTKAIAEHTKATVTTDFNGNAEFDPVLVGIYYVVAVTETRGGFAVWDFKVDVHTGKNQVTLDQNNAATAF